MIWKWIKKIFKPKKQILSDPTKPIDLMKLTKGDLKKLKAQGKIKDIYNPNN